MAAMSFAKALEAVGKDDPGVDDVHVASAGGTAKPKRAKTFHEVVNGCAPGALMLGKGGLDLEQWRRRRQLGDMDYGKAGQPRALKPLDDKNSHTPFPHDAGALANLRDDQVPRFLGALTDSDKLPTKSVQLNGLTAMQNRVDTGKVTAMQADPPAGKLPVVVRMGARNYIADGHHRLAAAYLNGDSTAEVRFKDLQPRDNAVKAAPDLWAMEADIVKIDEEHRLAFGFFSVVEKNGERVADSENDRISPEEIEKAAYGHVLNARIASDSHDRMGVGDLVESMVFTPEKCDAMVKCLADVGVVAKIDIPAIGWWGGYFIGDDDVWKAVKSGEYVSFSIGGSATRTPANGQ